MWLSVWLSVWLVLLCWRCFGVCAGVVLVVSAVHFVPGRMRGFVLCLSRRNLPCRTPVKPVLTDRPVRDTSQLLCPRPSNCRRRRRVLPARRKRGAGAVLPSSLRLVRLYRSALARTTCASLLGPANMNRLVGRNLSIRVFHAAACLRGSGAGSSL